MKDPDIRQALRTRLEAQHRPARGTKIFDELGICEGRVRVDMAVVNHTLHGFEIKSDRDTLARLDEQQRLYSKVFERMTIVAHGAHLPRVRDRVPAWWGVTQAIGIGSQSISFIERRPAEPNPACDPSLLVQLLWRDEVIAMLERRGIDRGVRTKPRHVAWERAASSLPLPELASEVRAALRRRVWRR